MKRTLFRERATAAYLSHETRGTIVQIAPPSMTLFFAVVTLLLLAGLGVAVFGRVQVRLEGRGRVHPSERAIAVRAARSGPVVSVLRAQGAPVTNGETIARLDTEAEAAELTSCRQELALVRSEVDLLGERAATVEGTDAVLLTMQHADASNRRSALEARCAELDRAIRRAIVRAPIDGVLDRVDVAAGDSVTEGDFMLGVVPRTAELIGSFEVPESRRAELEVGRRARLAFDAFPVEKFGMGTGRIRRLVFSNGADATTRTGSPREAGVIVAEVKILSMPRGVEHAETGMTFTAYVQTERKRLISLLFAASGS